MEKIIFFVTLVLIAIVTIPDGVRNIVASSTIAIAIYSLLLAYVLFFFNSTNCKFIVKRYIVIWIALISWIVITAIQAFEILGYESYDRYTSIHELILYVAYIGFLFLMLCLLSNVARIYIVVVLLISIAIAQTVFGMVNYYSGQTPFGWQPTHYAGSRVTGTFINRNYFANFVLMCLGFSLVPLMIRKASWPVSSALLGEKLNTGSLYLMMLGISVFMFAGILLSGSRGAIIAFVVAIIFTVSISKLNKNTKHKFGSILIIAVISLLLVGYKLLQTRMEGIISDAGIRMEQWRASMELFTEKWIMGFGPGSYEIAYKSKIPITANPLIHNHVHNDYLELMIEQGMVGALPLGVFLIFSLYFGVGKLKQSNSYLRVLLLLSSLFGIIAMLCHSLYDFPLQVPSNCLVFMLLFAILLASTHVSFRTRNRTV